MSHLGIINYFRSYTRSLTCEGFKVLELVTRKRLPQNQPRRYLNVHEHMSYALLQEAGICVPKYGVATSAKEAKDIACKLGTDDLVVKAQVLTGGRGKGTFKNGFKGGVQMAKCAEEVEELAGKMIDQLLITKQTGEEGKICKKVMITEQKVAKQEYYFSIMLERSFNGPVVIASSQGGVNIEEVAEKDPNAIFYQPIDYCKGLEMEQACAVADKVGLSDKREEIAEMLTNLYELFISKDALLVEINPYIRDCDDNFFALDAKLNFDDNADFRQKELFKLRDFTQVDPKEVEAAKYNLNYIALDGEIGCMVNGAGLAMATMDIVTLYKGSPANFLDVGGGASAEAVKQAFKIITSDPKVKVIYVNIFGGIMRCDIIAEGIVAATKELSLKVPIVVRLQGTNSEQARKLIQESKLAITAQDDFAQSSQDAVKLSKGGGVKKEGGKGDKGGK